MPNSFLVLFNKSRTLITMLSTVVGCILIIHILSFHLILLLMNYGIITVIYCIITVISEKLSLVQIISDTTTNYALHSYNTSPRALAIVKSHLNSQHTLNWLNSVKNDWPLQRCATHKLQTTMQEITWHTSRYKKSELMLMRRVTASA